MRYICKSLVDTERIATDFASGLSPRPDAALVFGLSGELGSGKTAFVQAVARCLGVSDQVTSPTFVIEKVYELSGSAFKRLVHIDAYRLEDGEELFKLGWREVAEDRGNLVLLEWPERVAEILPAHTRTIIFRVADGLNREIILD